MVSTGADLQGVEAALQGVRQTAWAAGRTLRPKYLVLLAFAEVRMHLHVRKTHVIVQLHLVICTFVAVQSIDTAS